MTKEATTTEEENLSDGFILAYNFFPDFLFHTFIKYILMNTAYTYDYFL